MEKKGGRGQEKRLAFQLLFVVIVVVYLMDGKHRYSNATALGLFRRGHCSLFCEVCLVESRKVRDLF